MKTAVSCYFSSLFYREIYISMEKMQHAHEECTAALLTTLFFQEIPQCTFHRFRILYITQLIAIHETIQCYYKHCLIEI